MFKRPCFYKKGKVIILGVEILNIQAGHFYFIKDEFFEEIKDKELMVNKENGHIKEIRWRNKIKVLMARNKSSLDWN